MAQDGADEGLRLADTASALEVFEGVEEGNTAGAVIGRTGDAYDGVEVRASGGGPGGGDHGQSQTGRGLLRVNDLDRAFEADLLGGLDRGVVGGAQLGGNVDGDDAVRITADRLVGRNELAD